MNWALKKDKVLALDTVDANRRMMAIGNWSDVLKMFELMFPYK